MKRFFILAFSVLTGTASFAQFGTQTDNSFIFVDKDGNMIESGSVRNVNEVEVTEDPDFGNTYMLKSGLYVKPNTSEHNSVGVNILIDKMPSVSVQHCFPGSCQFYTEIGVTSEKKAMDIDPASDPQDFQSEWVPDKGKYGTCTVEYTLRVYNSEKAYKKDKEGHFLDKDGNITTDENKKVFLGFYTVGNYRGDGPKVTVNYIYADPAGINGNVAEQKLNTVTYYDLSGRKVSNPANGVYVKKLAYADGTVKTEKVTVK